MVSVADFKNAIRPDTLLVSMMHVNNETGVIQPISEYAQALEGHDAYFHVDASQSFGKIIPDLRNKRIDLISASGHKIYAPKGIGILVARCRRYKEPPIDPIMVGGGQERGLRPGTLPVHLIVALGEAVDVAVKRNEQRKEVCRTFKEKILQALQGIGGIPNGDQSYTLENTLNISFPGIDSEAIILQLKDLISISNGSACTSSSYNFSHVLTSMGLSKERIKGSIRISWCHLTQSVDWLAIAEKIKMLRR
jgi:cysteine desulfurase